MLRVNGADTVLPFGPGIVRGVNLFEQDHGWRLPTADGQRDFTGKKSRRIHRAVHQIGVSHD